MAQKFADLHVHTQASDGEYPPEEVVRQASKAGLAAIGIVDHDSVDGIDAALGAGEKYGVEVIPGIELSSELGTSEIHVLGYFIDWHDKKFLALLNIIQDVRKWRSRKMVEKLQGLGINITYDEVLAEAGDTKAICRPHIARVLLKHGHIEKFQDAFDLYLKRDGPAYVKRYEMSTQDAIQTIRRVGGIPVLAHPISAQADEMLQVYIELGLRGLEVYHIKCDEAASKRYGGLARKHGLLITGGTDSHGPDDPVGTVRVPYEYVEKLKAERKL
jgi:predicted metal-dependent phosphoesterase TrpH